MLHRLDVQCQIITQTGTRVLTYAYLSLPLVVTCFASLSCKVERYFLASSYCRKGIYVIWSALKPGSSSYGGQQLNPPLLLFALKEKKKKTDIWRFCPLKGLFLTHGHSRWLVQTCCFLQTYTEGDVTKSHVRFITRFLLHFTMVINDD